MEIVASGLAVEEVVLVELLPRARRPAARITGPRDTANSAAPLEGARRPGSTRTAVDRARTRKEFSTSRPYNEVVAAIEAGAPVVVPEANGTLLGRTDSTPTGPGPPNSPSPSNASAPPPGQPPSRSNHPNDPRTLEPAHPTRQPGPRMPPTRPTGPLTSQTPLFNDTPEPREISRLGPARAVFLEATTIPSRPGARAPFEEYLLLRLPLPPGGGAEGARVAGPQLLASSICSITAHLVLPRQITARRGPRSLGRGSQARLIRRKPLRSWAASYRQCSRARSAIDRVALTAVAAVSLSGRVAPAGLTEGCERGLREMTLGM